MSKELDIRLSDIEGYANEIAEIIEFIEKAVDDAEKIGKLTFYKGGQAQEAVTALKDVPRRYESTIEHYSRLYQILGLTWQKMTEADQRIAQALMAHDR